MKTFYAFLFVLSGLFTPRTGWAQSADIPRCRTSVTGLNDPEPASPRYLKAAELAQLQEQESRQTESTAPALRTTSPDPLTVPSHALPKSSLSLRKQ